jgi:hypothetical protein
VWSRPIKNKEDNFRSGAQRHKGKTSFVFTLHLVTIGLEEKGGKDLTGQAMCV